MNINNWILFAQIVDAGGLTAASRKLGLPKSTLSRRLSKLEKEFGARLLTRRGRRFDLTDVGQSFYKEAKYIAEQVINAQERLTERTQQEEGVIKMAAPRMPGSTFLGYWLAEFLSLYPHIRVELDLSDNMVNLFDQGYDLALRVGPMVDSSLISRQLSKSQRILVASKQYIAQFGQPTTPQELDQYRCLSFSQQSSGQDTWGLVAKGKLQKISFNPAIRCDDMATILRIAKAGGGIALAPVFICRDLLEQRLLQQVLPEYSGPEAEFFLVYPERELMPKRVRLLLDFFSEKARTEQALFLSSTVS